MCFYNARHWRLMTWGFLFLRQGVVYSRCSGTHYVVKDDLEFLGL